jgi:TfoX/Sxy family transcriptional regulator of competence genes
MAFDEGLAQRIREQLLDRAGLNERLMFGGIAFMLHGNMAVGVTGEDLMVRVGPDGYDDALAHPNVSPFDMTGRPMRGWVVVAGSAIKSGKELADWVERGVRFSLSLEPK